MSPKGLLFIATAAFALLVLPALALDGESQEDGVYDQPGVHPLKGGDVEPPLHEEFWNDGGAQKHASVKVDAYLRSSKDRRRPVSNDEYKSKEFDGSHRDKNTLGSPVSNILSDEKIGQVREIIRVLGGDSERELNRYDPDSVFQALYEAMGGGSEPEPERGWLISVGMEMALQKFANDNEKLEKLKRMITEATEADPSCTTVPRDAATGSQRYADRFYEAGQVYLITNILKGIRTMCRFGHPDRMPEVPCVSQEALRTVLGSADAELMMMIDGAHDGKVVINIPRAVAQRVRETAVTPYLKALILAYGLCTYNVRSELDESLQCKPVAALLNILGGNPRTEGGITLFWSGDIYAKPAAAGVDPNTARVISLEGSTILGKFMGSGMTNQWNMLGAISNKHKDVVLCHTPGKETERNANQLWNELSDQFARTYGPTATADGEPRGDEIVVFQDAFRERNVFMATEAPRLLLEMCAHSEDDAAGMNFKLEIILSDQCMNDRKNSIEEIVEKCKDICEDVDVIAADIRSSCTAACESPQKKTPQDQAVGGESVEEEVDSEWSQKFHPQEFQRLYSNIQTKKDYTENGETRKATLFKYMEDYYLSANQGKMKMKWQHLNTLQNNIYCNLGQARSELSENVVKFNELLENTRGMEPYPMRTEGCAKKLVDNAFKPGTPMTIRQGDLSHVSLHRGIVPPAALAECRAQRARFLSEDQEFDALTTESCSPDNKRLLSRRRVDYSPIVLAEANEEQIVKAVNGIYVSCACAACGGKMKKAESSNEHSCEFPMQ